MGTERFERAQPGAADDLVITAAHRSPANHVELSLIRDDGSVS